EPGDRDPDHPAGRADSVRRDRLRAGEPASRQASAGRGAGGGERGGSGGARMNLIDVGASIAITFQYFTIIYLAGLGGLFSERSGIVNIGLEGLMIVGTVMGAYGAVTYGPVQGLLFGAGAGLLYAGIHAIATVTFKIDHIVS